MRAMKHHAPPYRALLGAAFALGPLCGTALANPAPFTSTIRTGLLPAVDPVTGAASPGYTYTPGGALLPNGSLVVTNPQTLGWAQQAVAGWFTANQYAPVPVIGGAWNGAGPGGVNGGPAGYPTIDSVALGASNFGPPALIAVSGTYDATHFYPTTPLTAGQIALLKANQWIETAHGTPWRSWIVSWAPDGTSITVKGWWQTGVSGYSTPGTAAVANIGAVSKVWSFNTVLDLEASSYANLGTGYELDIINNKTGAQPIALDIVGLGSVGSYIGSQVRGLWVDDYLARGGSTAGYMYDPTLDNVPVATVAGFASKQATGKAFAVAPSGGAATFSVDAASGAITVGTGTLAPTGVFFDHMRVSPGTVAGGPAYIDFALNNQNGTGGFNFRLVNAINGWMQMYGVRSSDGTTQLLASFLGADANSFRFTGAATGVAPAISSNGDANSSIALIGTGTGGAQTGAYIRTADPVVADIPAGRCVDWNNTTAATYKHVCNFAGTLRSVTMN
jgi:hypothetical protein